jgi:hypothetical protein
MEESYKQREARRRQEYEEAERRRGTVERYGL